MKTEYRPCLDDLIVKVLGQRPNMGVNQIHPEVNAFGRVYSIQAVYKQLGKLSERGIVFRLNNSYRLQLAWVHQLLQLSRNIERIYLEAKSLGMALPPSGKRCKWRLSSLLKAQDLLLNLTLMAVEESKSSNVLSWNPHSMNFVLQSDRAKVTLSSLELLKSKMYAIIGGRTSLDVTTSDLIDEASLIYSFAPSVFQREHLKYINVVGQYIIVMKLDALCSKAIEDIFTSTLSPLECAMKLREYAMHTKVRVRVRIEKNAALASRYYKKFSQYFGIRLTPLSHTGSLSIAA